jgi:hypothetical protein
MKNYDHSKLNPIISEIEQIIHEEMYDQFQIKILDCLSELKAHIEWEKSDKGTLYLIEKDNPQYEKDIKTLMTDHKFFIEQLEKVLYLSDKNISEAVELFDDFKQRRTEHIQNEDELDIKVHTKNFNDFFH